MDVEMLRTVKALSDATRLRIVGMLASGRSLSIDDLALALTLRRTTIAHHIGRLRDAQLVAVASRGGSATYALRPQRLAALGRDLGRLEREAEAAEAVLPTPDGAPRPVAEQKLLRSFFGPDGRLVRIPAQEKKRLPILRFLAETCFEEGRAYPEKEVNMALALRHPDVASLRRYLVDYGYMERQAGVYRLRPAVDRPRSVV